MSLKNPVTPPEIDYTRWKW